MKETIKPKVGDEFNPHDFKSGFSNDQVKALMGEYTTPIVFYPFHRELAGSCTGGILLAYLLYQFDHFKKESIWKTDEEVITRTALTPSELKTAKRCLRESTYIDIVKRGMPARTFYEVNWFELFKLLRAILDKRDELVPDQSGEIRPTCRAKSAPLVGRNPPDIIDIHNRETKEELSPPANAGTATDTQGVVSVSSGDGDLKKHSRWKRWAEMLAASISTVKRVNCKSQIPSWAVSFYQLHKTDGVPLPRIKQALVWYCNYLPLNYGGEFFLDIQSGKAFRKKFQSIEAAIIREKRRNGDDDDDGRDEYDMTGEPQRRGEPTCESIVVGEPISDPEEIRRIIEESEQG